jgi:hypothetical protein
MLNLTFQNFLTYHKASISPELKDFVVDIYGVGHVTRLDHVDQPVESYESPGAANPC